MERNSSITAEVTVSPRGHLLVDDKLHIRVQGLDCGQHVTIHTGINVSRNTMESCCQFRADKNGVVDLYHHPSLAGSYTGVSPMGIFWSMVPTPDMPKGFRMMVKNVNKPIKAELNVLPGNHTVDEFRTKQLTPIVTRVIERWYKGQGVTSVKVAHGRLRGTLFLPQGRGTFPAVIDLFGTVGGLVEFRSALLASRGIASLALAYFLYDGLPQTVLDVELDYFLDAVRWLLQHPKVHGEGLGVVGVSKGGDIGLMMAANCPKISACVSINGCTFNANGPMKFSGGEIPGIMPDLGKMTRRGDDVWSTEKVYEYDETDLIPAWRHNPKILNILSEDDAVSPLDSIHLMKQHYPKDKVDNFMMLSYPGAGHLLEPPYTPLCNISYHKYMGSYIWWGGQPKPHADAQEDAWRQLLTFLHNYLPKANPSRSKL